MNQIGQSRRSYYHKPATSPYLHATLAEVFDATAQRFPNKTAAIIYQNEDQRECWTFADLQNQYVALATGLRQRGYTRGDRVAVFAPNCSEYFAIGLALGRLGCNAFLFSNLNNLADDVKQYACRALLMYIKNDDDKVVCEKIAKTTTSLFTFGTYTAGMTGLSVPLSTLVDEGRAIGRQQLPGLEELSPDDPLFVFFTSGSTGRPKGVQFTHSAFLNISSFNETIGLREDSVSFNDRPMTWSVGMNSLVAMAVSGCTAVTMNTSLTVSQGEVDFVMRLLKRERCTHSIMMHYFMVDLLGRSDHSPLDVPSLQTIFTGGQILDTHIVHEIMQLFPNVTCIVDGYGSTEIGAGALHFYNATTNSEYMKAVEGIEVKLLDDNGLDIPPGTEGELCVRSPWIQPTCYVDNEGASRKAMDAAGWFHTADVAVMNREGGIKICGRKDDMIKRATIKVFPAEVESVLCLNPAVKQVVVVGVPDARLGEELCACVIMNDDCTADGLGEWCKEHFSAGPDGLSLAPKYFMARSEFPKTRTGKTDRKLVRQLAIQHLNL